MVSATCINLPAALRSIVDDEFSLNGIRGVLGVDDEEPALLHHLPKSLKKPWHLHLIKSDFSVWEYQARKVYFLDSSFNQSVDNGS